jgi:hypothetical protein
MINSLHNLSSRENATVETVVKARQALQIQLTDIATKEVSLGRELESAKEKLQQLTQELTAKRIPKTTSNNEIAIKIMAKKEVKAEFKITYIVNSARWYPSYNVRVKTINDPLNIEYKANISQQTGEDWTDVKLKLSTTDPSLTGQKPKLQKWSLYLNQNYQQPQTNTNFQKYTGSGFTRVSGKITDEYGEPLLFASIMAVGSTVGTTADEEGSYSLSLPMGVTQITVSYVGYESVTLNVTNELLNVILKANSTMLEEVNIVSYDVPLNGSVEIGRNNIVRMPERSVANFRLITGGVPAGYGDATGGVIDIYTRGARSKKFNASSSVPLIVTPSENQVNAEFIIDEKYSIQSDTKSYMVTIQDISTKAGYQYYCAPKLDKDVFLTAQLTDWENYNLLEGQANIFFEGTYVGTSLMDVRYLTDTLNISLGRDKSIQVDRKKSRELDKRKVLGSDMVAYRDWDIRIRNGKQHDIHILVEDQFPVAADARIEVKREAYSGGKVDDLTGIVTWDLTVGQKNTTDIKLRYSVVHPKNSFVGLD